MNATPAKSSPASTSELRIGLGEDFVATVEIRRPPHNFFDAALLRELSETFAVLDDDPRCRAVLLCSEGKNFCAGARLTTAGEGSPLADPNEVYGAAIGMFAATKPVVAAVQGSAVGGGLGLACMADFRVAGPSTTFVANFARLGFHHGFALTVTLPPLVGETRAAEMLYSGQRVSGLEAVGMGLCSRLADSDDTIRPLARELAGELAAAAPLAVQAMRRTMRAGLVERVRTAMEHEAIEQQRLRLTADCAEGIQAAQERRAPRFAGL